MGTITDSDSNVYTLFESTLTDAQREAGIQKGNDLVGLQSSASEIDEVVGIRETLNPIDYTKMTQGYLSGYTLNASHLDYWYYPEFIEVTEGQVFRLMRRNEGIPIKFKVLSIYDSEKVDLSIISSSTIGTIPTSAKYVRLCIYKSEVSEDDFKDLYVSYNGEVKPYNPAGKLITRANLASDAVAPYKETSFLAYGDSITADERLLNFLNMSQGASEIKNMAIGGANLSSPSTRDEVANQYDWRTDYPNSASDDFNDRNILPQVRHTPNTLRHKYNIIDAKYLQDNGSYIFKPDIVIISAGFNDHKWATAYDTYDDVKDLTYTDLKDRQENFLFSGRKIFTYLRMVLEELLNGEITETQDGYTYGVDASQATFYFVTPIQSAYPFTNGIELLDIGDALQELLDDYSVKRIDAYRNSGICKRYEIDGAEGKFLEDGIHPNTEGYKKLGNYMGSVIASTYTEL